MIKTVLKFNGTAIAATLKAEITAATVKFVVILVFATALFRHHHFSNMITGMPQAYKILNAQNREGNGN